MAERDGATVHVDLRLIDAEFVDRCKRHRGEGLVDLEEIKILDVDTSLRRGESDCSRGLRQEGGVGSSDLAVAH